MRVILMQDIRHTGRRGEIIDVKPGFARNFLLPQGLALEANAGNTRYFEEQRSKIDAIHEVEVDKARAEAAELAGVNLTIAKRVGETETLYGSVTASEIALLLEEQDIQIDKRRIDLEGGIKTLGDHTVRIEIHADVIAEIAVKVVAEE